MSGGDDGLYYDSKASQNYRGAIAAGKAVGMYHFAGGGDPIAEAEYFLRACSPLAENDVLVLDWEIQHANPVEWCRAFIQHIKDKTGVTCMIYMNTSTENVLDWTPVINLGCGLWVADYRFTPAQNVPIHRWKTYIMHQYTSTPLDRDVFFGTVDQFKKYGYHAPVAPAPAPAPLPATPPAPAPAPVPPVVPPAPEITEHDKVQDAQIGALQALLQKVVDFLTSIFTGFKK